MDKDNTTRAGVTLIELVITMLIAGIVLLGIAIVMVDAHTGYRKMFERVHGSVENDAYVARIKFDSICRSASKFDADIIYDSTNPGEITVFSYSDNISPTAGPDRYAKFSLNGTDMMLEEGPASYGGDPEIWTLGNANSSFVVATNVTELKFSVRGRSLEMTVTINDGKYGITVTSSAVRHN